jgi:preprotein translocase subunit SecA
MNILQRLFDNNEREVDKYRRQVEKINALEPAMKALTDAELSAKTEEFRSRACDVLEAELEQRGMAWDELEKDDRRIISDLALDPLLVEVFAVVREAGRRVLGMRHFDVQLIGGMVTHDGRVGELKTGEGKTLMATLPLYLNALLGLGAHLVTPNDYLSKFGAVSMGPLYHFLGMTIGVIQGASPETGEGGGTFIFDSEYNTGESRSQFMRPSGRRGEAYACDVTYGTNNEYGFDYLRDNLARGVADFSQRDLYFAIVDEADSILIDEARTPLIISGPTNQSSELYVKLDRIIRNLQDERDYTLEEKAKTATFTEEGQERVEKFLGIDNLADSDNVDLMQHASAALKAHAVYKKDIDYVVKFNEQKRVNEVVIVDEFTGRLMFGRRWGDGLHQAIEAKEGVRIENESQTYATITFQNYFRLYTKLAGMTGTAKTEEEELRKVYALDVVQVPTNKPMVRTDLADVVYKSQEAKLRGITLEILRLYTRQQPVLVGTRNIETSERVSNRLEFARLEMLGMITVLRDKIDNAKLDKEKYAEWSTLLNTRLDQLTLPKLAVIAREFALPTNPRDEKIVQLLAKLIGAPATAEHLISEALLHGIPHNILNAKYHEKEAHIIAEAGRKGGVTIATNMAGRGVDILLGGSVVPVEEENTDLDELDGNALPSFRRGGRRDDNTAMTSLQAQETDAEHRAKAEEVRAAGGLFILGTERHESRRIDNQLRGRAGRQGDPGASRFFVSLEDELWRMFGDKTQSPLLASWSEEQSIDAKLLSKMIERAQKKVEQHNFDIRKNVLNYDDVMNTQREVIYSQRRKVLEGANLRATMTTYLSEVILGDMSMYAPESAAQEEWDLAGLFNSLNQTFPLAEYVENPAALEDKTFSELEQFLTETAETAYEDKEKFHGSPLMRDIERHWTLTVLDRHWMEHLSNMDHLKEGIGWRGIGGQDPVVLYKKEAFDMFQSLLGGLQDEVIRLVFHTRFEPVQPVNIPPQDLIEMGADLDGDGMEDPGAQQTPVLATRSAGAAALAAGSRPTSTRKVGRNDPCPCGSGKKYKLCHGR